MSIRVDGGTVVGWSGSSHELIPNGSVSIEGDSIKFVGTDKSQPADRVIDASEKLVCPGFVNMHVDKSRAHEFFRCIDHPVGGLRLVRSNKFDRVAFDRHAAVGDEFVTAPRPTDYRSAVDAYAHANYLPQMMIYSAGSWLKAAFRSPSFPHGLSGDPGESVNG